MNGGDRLRGIRSWPDRGDERAELIDAVISLAAEHGFAELNIKLVVERVGVHYRNFHRHFASLEEAFAFGYEELAERVCEDVLTAGRTGRDWRAGFRAALQRFLAWVAEEPGLARVLLSEYRLGDERTWEIQERCLERLSRALDSVRSQEPDRVIPQSAARLLLGSIEFVVAERVRRGRAASAPELEPSLAYYVVSIYFDNEVAGEELEQG